MNAALPVGPAVDPTPAQLPGIVTLAGRYGSVERLSAARHGASLWQAMGGHDHIWTYLPSGPFSDEAAFAAYLAHWEQSRERVFYTVIDRDNRAIGVLALMEVRPAHRAVEVGNVVFSPLLQRTRLATEAQYLIARYAIETLGYRRYEWKCNALNAASMAAARRLGFTYEGTFRQHMIVKGHSRDTAWLSILDSEWPARKAAFERWLAPENFDRDGKQKTKLGRVA